MKFFDFLATNWCWTVPALFLLLLIITLGIYAHGRCRQCFRPMIPHKEIWNAWYCEHCKKTEIPRL